MKFTRMITLILSLILLSVSFVACDLVNSEDPAMLQTNAALKLLEAPYIMTMTTSYTCGDKEINEKLQNIGAEAEIVMNVDGKNFTVETKMLGQSARYTIADDYIYMDILGVKMKSKVDENEVEDMLNIGAADIKGINVDVFSNVKSTREGDGSVKITCKGISDETNELFLSLADAMKSLGESTTVELDKENFECIFVIGNDGRYESISMSTVINIVVESEKLEISYGANMAFNYKDATAVSAPKDADSYIYSGYAG